MSTAAMILAPTRTSRAGAAAATAAAIAIICMGERFRFVVVSEAFAFQEQRFSIARRSVPTMLSTARCSTNTNKNGEDEERTSCQTTRRLRQYNTRRQHHHHQLRLYSSSADIVEESSSSWSSSAPIVKDAQAALIADGYRVGQYVFGATAAILMCIPDRTLTAKLAAKWGGAMGYALTSGLSFILAKQASSKDPRQRLASETYKRLNVGILGFSLLGLAAIPGEAGFFYTLAPAMVLSAMLFAVHVFGIVLSYSGWKYAVLEDVRRMMNLENDPPTTTTTTGSSSSSSSSSSIHSSTTPSSIASIIQQLAQELWRGTKATVHGCWRVQNTKKALTYRNCLLLILTGCFSNFMDGIFHLRYQDVFQTSYFEVSLAWSAVARLWMISTMVYSLKDAAERDRLTGTTFIQMNVLVGAWAALVGLGQAINPLGMQGYRGVTMFALSLPFFIKAIKAMKQKKELQNSPLSDEEQ